MSPVDSSSSNSESSVNRFEGEMSQKDNIGETVLDSDTVHQLHSSCHSSYEGIAGESCRPLNWSERIPVRIQSVTSRNLTLSYSGALVVVALLVTIGYVFTFELIREYRSTQNIVNSITRQRAHLQSVAFLVEQISNSTDTNTLQRLQRTLANRLAGFSKADGIAEAEPSLWQQWEQANSGYYSEALGLKDRVRLVHDTAKRVAEAPDPFTTANSPDVQAVFSQDSVAETAMAFDTFINLASMDTDRRLTFVKRAELFIYLLIITFLACLGWFLFRPMVKAVIAHQKQQRTVNLHLENRANELSKSREGLRRQTRIVESVVNTMGDALIVVDENGQMLLQNPEADRLFGVASPGMDMKPWHQHAGLQDPESRDPLLSDSSPIGRAIRGERSAEHLIVIRNRHTRRDVFVSVTARPMTDEEGVNRGAVISFHDISPWMESQEQLRRAKAKAEQANVAKTQFLANMSHEIRTPMGSVLGYADKLLTENQPVDERRRCVQIIRRNGRVLMDLIDDLLDISKIEAGQVEVEHEVVHIEPLITEVMTMLHWRAHEKGVELSVEFNGAIPQEIKTDPTRLRQILTNIVGNAVKFTSKGRVQVTLSLKKAQRLGVKRHELEVAIRDSGCGIPHEQVNRLFRPFSQADSSTTRRYGGTGLGLALSRRLARLLGGDLILKETAVAKGSTFVLTIDPGELEDVVLVQPNSIDLSNELAGAKHRFSDTPPFPTNGLEGRHILVVEDGRENRDLFRFYLQTAGAKVAVAEDGLEGVEITQQHSFDAVLMDIQMPRMDGYAAIRAMKKAGVDCPIIALTAHAFVTERERCRKAGFSQHLAKPVDAHTLISTLASILNQHDAGQTGTAETGRVLDADCATLVENGKPARVGASAGDPEPGATTMAEALDPDPADEELEAMELPDLSHYPEAVRRIIEEFFDDLPVRLEALAKAAAKQEWQEVGRLAHKLKGAAGACGFQPVMDKMLEVEGFLDNDDNLPAVEPLLSRLRRQVERTRSDGSFA